MNGEEILLSFTSEYEFYAYRDMVLEAKYGSTSEKPIPVVKLECSSLVTKASFLVTRTMPDFNDNENIYTYVASGVLITKTEEYKDKLLLENVETSGDAIRNRFATFSGRNGQFMLTMTSSKATKDNPSVFYAVGYLTVLLPDGTPYTYYTEVGTAQVTN